jgi:hypothetical protein
MRVQTKRVFWIDNKAEAIDLDIALQSGCIVERSFESQNGVFVILVNHYPNGTPWVFPQNGTVQGAGTPDSQPISAGKSGSPATDCSSVLSNE